MNEDNIIHKSFLYWPGGKSNLVSQILDEMPDCTMINRYIEPFVGGGSVVLNVPYAVPKIINDVNPGLIAVYRALKHRPLEFIPTVNSKLTHRFNNKETYYRLRSAFNKKQTRADLFVYLNKLGFNGLCRFNAKGHFNVAYGYRKPQQLISPEMELLHASTVMQNTSIFNVDFREVLESACEGDVIYCDPPYIPLSQTSNFTSYSTGGFSIEDQKDLARLARRAHKKGATVIVSNSDTTLSRQLYQGAIIHDVSVMRRLGSAHKKATRKQSEILAVYKAPQHSYAKCERRLPQGQLF